MIATGELNVGVVGLGRMGQRHALNILQRVSGARLFSVCTPAPHELQWAREHLEPQGVQVFAEFDDMIGIPGLEAVIIASSTPLHVEHTEKAIERGVHVLCEKPITTDLSLVRMPRVIPQATGFHAELLTF
jgi:myo-inositol 2-dehydrogenase/D-chiro-inositol 1-dehydrogenase